MRETGSRWLNLVEPSTWLGQARWWEPFRLPPITNHHWDLIHSYISLTLSSSFTYSIYVYLYLYFLTNSLVASVIYYISSSDHSLLLFKWSTISSSYINFISLATSLKYSSNRYREFNMFWDPKTLITLQWINLFKVFCNNVRPKLGLSL